jgi:branched-chain amino acid transport system ATP-binding protein
MTVADALATACERHVTEPGALHALFGLPEVQESENAVFARVSSLLDDFGLVPYRDRFVGDLSTGMRRILQLACLVAADATVMLLDEPAAGVAQREVPGMARLIQETQRRTGAAIVLVEHDLGLVRSIADRVIVLDGGVVLAEGPPDVVLDDPAVQLAYLGRVIRRRGQRVSATSKA